MAKRSIGREAMEGDTRPRRVVPVMAAALALLRFQALHWGDIFIAEESPLRLFLLKRYAWMEVRLLAFFYWLLRRPFMAGKAANRFFYYALAKFAGEHMVAGQVMTLEEMLDFIDGLPEESRVAVGPCRCRLATHACDHPLETDIVILSGTDIWLDLFPRDYHVISKEEAKRRVRECYEMGLVPMLDRHMYFRGTANYFVICNCCKCACLPIWAYRTYKKAGYHYIPSAYRSVVDLDKCEGCGTCVEVCAFEERRLTGGKAEVLACQGCGLCVKNCPNQANRMLRRDASG
ncbi:MAG: 4Fe-4S binding protein [Actinobacteria bacterium]|nr:4Fe-4S binding protein [Actinomycetota bacterium]